MITLPERIAQAALDQFGKLPAKYKPRTHPDGRREWTPLAAVVAVHGESVECLSLGTGTKCLPARVLPKCNGSVLHDSHAEVLALRGFNRWVSNELHCLLEHSAYDSRYIRRCEPSATGQNPQASDDCRPFAFKDDVTFHFFTTEAPCGDASMELLMASKASEEAVPWKAPGDSQQQQPETPLLGRGYFSQLGVVRRKPCRADAEATMSKSCTDKLSIKQFTGILAFPADCFIKASTVGFLKSLVVYSHQYHHIAYERAFGPTGRLMPVAKDLHFFNTSVLPTSFADFEYCRTVNDAVRKASNLSALWICGWDEGPSCYSEVLHNGVKEGYKQFESRSTKSSMVCRRELWQLGRKIATLIAHGENPNALEVSPLLISMADQVSDENTRYCNAKANIARSRRNQAQLSFTRSLPGWIPNVGDNEWSLSGR